MKSLGKMSNEELRAEYQQEAGHPFQRSPIGSLSGMPRSYWIVVGILAASAVITILGLFFIGITF